MVKDLADYIKNLPDRIMKAITGMIENIGIPEFKILGKSFGPYYPFRGDGEVKQEDTQGSPTTSKTIMPEAKNKEGISDDLNLKEFSPTVPVTTSSNKATKKPFDEAEYKKLEGTTSYIKDPVSGEGVTIRKAPKQMTKEQAMEVLGKNENQGRIRVLNEQILKSFRNGLPMPNVSELVQMQMVSEDGSPQMNMFKDAVLRVYPELIKKLYDSETKDGKNASDLLKDLNDPTSEATMASPDSFNDAYRISNENFKSVFSPMVALEQQKWKRGPKGFEKVNSLATPQSDLSTTKSDSGNAIMDSSAAAEAAKSKDSSNVVINAPSSTVNAPKSSNMVMPENIRNNEPSMSRYVDGLSGVNI
jgi:hypothetical protein